MDWRGGPGAAWRAEAAGLGLAIVTAVTRAHGGELRLRRVDGGFEAALVLPAEAAR